MLRDLERFLSELVPDGDRRFVHDAEGPDDMPAHVRAALTQVSIGVPVRGAGCTSAPGRGCSCGSIATPRTAAGWT